MAEKESGYYVGSELKYGAEIKQGASLKVATAEAALEKANAALSEANDAGSTSTTGQLQQLRRQSPVFNPNIWFNFSSIQEELHIHHFPSDMQPYFL